MLKKLRRLFNRSKKSSGFLNLWKRWDRKAKWGAGLSLACSLLILSSFQNCSPNAANDATAAPTTTSGSTSTTTTTTSSYSDPSLLTISNATVTEGSTLGYVVTLTQSSSSDLYFQYQTVDGTALADSDYTASSGTLTFYAGETSKTISIATTADSLVEGTEYFYLRFGQFDTATNYRNITISITDANSSTTAASSISGGFFHTCAVQSGAVKCWGLNAQGQLGDGTTDNRTTPVAVSGVDSSVTSVAAGGNHSCAIQAGNLKCWGYNIYGQLGNGTATNRSVATNVTSLSSSVTQVSAGANFTCAIMADALYCWGYNDSGQLGNGTTTNALGATAVRNITSGVTAVSAGNSHACGIVSGALYCWGNNQSGQLGDGTTTNQTVPQPVSGMGSGVTSVSAAMEHTCAVQNSKLKCWGANTYGQIGDGTITAHVAPFDMGLSDVSSVSTGIYTTCAISVTNGLKCWGSNSYGQLGLAATYGYTMSPKVMLTSGAQFVANSQGYHMCGLLNSTVYCWGYNYYGGLGIGSTTNQNMPIAVKF